MRSFELLKPKEGMCHDQKDISDRFDSTCTLLCRGIDRVRYRTGEKSAAMSKPEYTFYFVSHGGPGDPYWQAFINGVNDAAKSLNVRIVYVYPQKEGDVNELIKQLNSAIAAKPDGIGVTVDDEQGFSAPLLDAKKQGNQRTAEILRDIGIRDLNPTTPVSALSGGERQAVAIGRTYYFGGKLLILDEPTSALSVKQTQKVFSIIQEVKAKGVSVILIEHNMIHVHEIADRLVVMRRGTVFGDYRKSKVGITDLERILAGVR